MWMGNLITPIVEKNSSIHQQFINKSWTHGVPLTKTKDETVDFLQKYMKPPDIGGTMALLQYLNQEDDNSTGVSAGISGREAPLDPSAPAAKTLALLKMSGIDIEAYIISISPSFNTDGEMLLQLYYQIAQDGVSYRMSPDRAKPDNPFSVMLRSEMIAKTNIEVQAKNFNFDSLEENKKDMLAWQMFRPDPAFNKYPEAVYILMKHIIKGISPKWNNLVDQLMPSPEQFKKEQLTVAVQAIGTYVKGMIANAKVTGTPPEIDPRQLLAIMQQAQKEAVTPPTPEEQKAREQNANQ